ncbi:MAG: hypothetical protein WAL45_03355 [Terracidiphilus sp.]
MEIHIFAERFTNGSWDFWEHRCGPKEADALVNCATARASGRAPSEKPSHNDFLESARQMFNVALGEPSSPRNGDTRVYCVCVGQVVIGVYEKVRQYSQRIAEAHHFAELALEKSA